MFASRLLSVKELIGFTPTWNGFGLLGGEDDAAGPFPYQLDVRKKSLSDPAFSKHGNNLRYV